MVKKIHDAFRGLALVYRAQGDSFANARRWKDALIPYHRSKALLEQMRKDFPRVTSGLPDLAYVRDHIGQVLMNAANLEKKEKATQLLQEATDSFCQAYADLSRRKNGDSAVTLADSAYGLGVLAGRAGICLVKLDRLLEARTKYEAALLHLKDAVRLDKTKPVYVDTLLVLMTHLTEILLRLGHHQKLASAVKEWREMLPNNGGVDYRAARALAQCILVAQKDSNISEAERDRLTQIYAAESVDALRAWIKNTYVDRNDRFNPNLLTQLKDLKPLERFKAFTLLVTDQEKKFQASTPKLPLKQP